MGQFDNYGIGPVGEIGLPKRGNRAFLERYEKPKPKTKSAPAGSPPPGPKKPGPNNNDKKDPPGGALIPRKPKPKYPSNGAAALIKK